MSWIRNWKRACAGGVSFGMHIAEVRCLGGINENACMFGKTDGTWNGHINGSSSTILPTNTISDLLVYELKWDATDTIGDVELRLGAAGNEQEPNVDLVLISKSGASLVLAWDDATSRYIGTDLEAVTGINSIFVVDEEFCFNVGFVPEMLIHYTFETLETGVEA